MTWHARLARIVADDCGVRLADRPCWRLERFVRARAIAMGLPDEQAYIDTLEAHRDEEELAKLADVVTTSQTAFMRDASQLDIAMGRWTATPARPPEIWSAGCATGQECYSLVLVAMERGIDCRVLGTDINRSSLRTARAAVYPTHAIAGLAAHHRARSSPVPGGFKLLPELAARVRFRRHNLLQDPLPRPASGAWDLIVCRNVLIYFDRTTAAKVTERLGATLAPGGWLLLGASDPVPATGVAGLRTMSVDGHIVHCREPAAAGPTTEANGLVALLSRGNEALGVHDFARARALYERAIVLAPNDGEAAYLLGVLQRKLGAYPVAASWFRRALQNAPQLWPARFLLASCLERAGEHDRALAHYSAVLEQLRSGRDVDVLRSRVTDLHGLDLPPTQVAAQCRARIKPRTAPTRR